MTRIILLSLVLTFSLSAKTLDNKAFCEAIEKGRESSDLKNKGQTVKGKRLLEEVETKLKTLIIAGTKIIPDENLRVIKRREVDPEYVIECLTEKNYYKQSGSFWVCSEINYNCKKSDITISHLIEKIEEESINKQEVSIKGVFQFHGPRAEYFYDEETGIRVTVKILEFNEILTVNN